MKPERAWVRLSPSGRPLNLLQPEPLAWEDRDLSVGLSRTYRWGGHSAWELPLSVAQHSLTVLAIRRSMPGPDMTLAEQLRELLHDADDLIHGGDGSGAGVLAGVSAVRVSRCGRDDQRSRQGCHY